MPNKPNIELDPVKWTPAERSEFLQKGFRSHRPDEEPQVTFLVRPSDYAHDLDRGTTDFKPEWTNYSFMKVRVPSDTTIRGCNFAQCVPNTDAIKVQGNQNKLTLIDCNLVNVKLNPNWTLQGCNTAQAWLVDDGQGGEERQFITDHPRKLTGNEAEPARVVKSRNF